MESVQCDDIGPIPVAGTHGPVVVDSAVVCNMGLLAKEKIFPRFWNTSKSLVAPRPHSF